MNIIQSLDLRKRKTVNGSCSSFRDPARDYQSPFLLSAVAVILALILHLLLVAQCFVCASVLNANIFPTKKTLKRKFKKLKKSSLLPGSGSSEL